mgnify:CR=1 FL=1
MRGQHPLVLAFGIVLVALYWATLRARPLRFQVVVDGGRVEGTEYVYQTKEVERTNSDGKKFARTELYLLNTLSGGQF